MSYDHNGFAFDPARVARALAAECQRQGIVGTATFADARARWSDNERARFWDAVLSASVTMPDTPGKPKAPIKDKDK